MKFGIPEDYDIGFNTEEIGSQLLAASIDSRKDDNIKVTTKAIINYIESQSNGRNEDLLPQFNSFRRMMHQYSKSIHSRLMEDEKTLFHTIYNLFVYNKSSAEANIDSLVSDFDKSLKLQTSEVDKIIAQEEERKRLERVRLEREEQERKRKEEEERRRKEEQAQKIKEEEERIRKEQEAKKHQEDEEARQRQQKEQEIKQEQEKQEKLALEQKTKQEKGLTNFSSIEKEFFRYKHHISDIKHQVVVPLSENKELKKAVGGLKRKINPKFGQLSNSVSQLNKITSEVVQYVDDAKNHNELAYKWILNFIAKAIIAQAETEVTVKSTASLPLARLAYNLLIRYNEFEYFLTARFIKKCPFIIGYTCSIDSEEGRKRMGWKRNGNKWEDEVKYDERVAGICTVWTVMTRLQEQSISTYSISLSWKFLARLLNTDSSLLTNAHFACVGNWWDACAKEFLNHYGKQAYKLLHLLSIEWTNSVANKKFPAAARLLILGEDWLLNNNIDSIKEMES